MSREPEIILENHYGSHQPAVFCEEYEADIAAQGLSDLADIIIRADREVSVLYDGLGQPALSGEELADLTEQASCAWQTILEKFVPEEGYHLDYMPDDQALWMIPDDWHDPDFD